MIKMSKENIVRFISNAMSDREMAEKMTAFAAENGYEFTAEELFEFNAVQPLSESEAESVTGGIATRISKHSSTNR